MKMWHKGFYVRYGGDTIQFGLPFEVTQAELDNLFSALSDTLYDLP